MFYTFINLNNLNIYILRKKGVVYNKLKNFKDFTTVVKYSDEMFNKYLNKYLQNDVIYDFELTKNIKYDLKIVKDFQKFNNFDTDLISRYEKSSSKKDFLDNDLIELIYNLFILEYKQYADIKYSTQYFLLLDSIKNRLLKMYDAFLLEDLKKMFLLKKAIENNQKIKIIDSKFLDTKVGVDFILILHSDVKASFFIHSVKGSQSSLDYLHMKQQKIVYYKNYKNESKSLNRYFLFNSSFHKTFKDLNTADFYNKEKVLKYLEEYADTILTDFIFLQDSKKEESIQEFYKIEKILRDNNSEDSINIIKNYA